MFSCFFSLNVYCRISSNNGGGHIHYAIEGWYFMSSYYRFNNRQSSGGGFSFFPPVLKTLLIANVAVYVLEVFFLSSMSMDGIRLRDLFQDYFALQPWESGLFYPWQLLTYQFMHGGFGHLFWNLFALWMFGAELENLWGSRRFIVFYLLCGIGAGVVQLLTPMLPFVDPLPTVGASGAIYGVLLAFGLTFPDRPIIMFPIFFPIPAKIFVLLYAGIDLLQGIFNPGSSVAHFAHLGGAFFGYMLLKHGDDLRIFDFFERWLGKINISAPKKQTKQGRVYSLRDEKIGSGYFDKQGDEISQGDIDAILDKMSSTGFQSLTDKEKQILYEASKKMQ